MGKLKKGRDGKVGFEAVPCWAPMLIFAGSKWFSYLKLLKSCMYKILHICYFLLFGFFFKCNALSSIPRITKNDA